MWEEIKNSKQGTCPKCNSEDIDYSGSEFEGDGGVVYPLICDSCGFEGREWYVLKFVGIWENVKVGE